MLSSVNSSMLTTKEYEDQQIVANTTQDDLGRDAFLQLFTTQLKNQNPLDPMGNEAFVAQLAQFSSLESMKSMEGTMSEVANLIRDEKFVGGANLLGKKIALQGGQVVGGGGVTANGDIELANGAESVIVSIYEPKTGDLVARQTLGNQSKGTLPLTWDGLKTNGDIAPYGNYVMSASVVNGAQMETAMVKTSATVRAVTWDASAQDILVELDGGLKLSLAQVDRIEI
jgi:flagellar basal-body rod modification protein FlgD